MSAPESRYIEVDGSLWTDIDDLYRAIFAAIRAPSWHGTSPDALNDSMVFGGINGLGPPYDLVITNLERTDVARHIDLIRQVLEQGRSDYRESHGCDVEVSIRLEGQTPVR